MHCCCGADNLPTLQPSSVLLDASKNFLSFTGPLSSLRRFYSSCLARRAFLCFHYPLSDLASVHLRFQNDRVQNSAKKNYVWILLKDTDAFAAEKFSKVRFNFFNCKAIFIKWV